MLVGSVTDPSEIEEIQKLVDVVELRLDYFSIKKKPIWPCIFTLRKKEQGGRSPLSEEQRLEMILKYLELQPDYFDIEADTDPEFIAHIAKEFPSTKLIGSYHNFEETPEDLDALLKSMKSPHFAIIKIAVTARSSVDLIKLMIFKKNARVPLSVISMGYYGKPSRVLGPIVGNALDYVGLKEDLSLHRYSIHELLDTFCYRTLNQKTQVYALLGDPVEKSPSDLFHNRCFKQNAVYIKLPLKKEEVRAFFDLVPQFPFKGFSVTIPLKEMILPLLDELSVEAKTIGAVNTISIEDKLYGSNTDAPGALNAIEKVTFVEGKKVAILGAGGTARAICYEAKKRGADVLIFNRTPERSKTLAKEFGASGYALEEIVNHSYDILVNTTPPNSIDSVDPLPNSIVMDVVYDPKETPLLIKAQKKGCRVIYGEEMFIEQAILQQNEWAYTSST